jgi:mannose-1-phosphate guanylyltransferase
MLVAAGFGTRLDPLTRELPKPALPVANRPVAWFAADHVVRSGVSEVLVNTHHLARELREALEPCFPAGAGLRFVHEPRILGTGGGVKNAWRAHGGEDEDLLVFNAKLLFAPDLHRALAVHRQRGAIATMVLRALPAGSGFTAVEVDGEGRVLRIGPYGAQGASAGAGTRADRMYTGVQVLSPRALPDLPEDGDIMRESYARWLSRGELVASVTEEGFWMDVGVTPRHYLDANLALCTGTVRWPGLAPGPGGVFMADSARIEGDCVLEHAAVGSGARVAGGVQVRRAVVWPNARVTSDLHDAVATSAGNIVHA